MKFLANVIVNLSRHVTSTLALIFFLIMYGIMWDYSTSHYELAFHTAILAGLYFIIFNIESLKKNPPVKDTVKQILAELDDDSDADEGTASEEDILKDLENVE